MDLLRGKVKSSLAFDNNNRTNSPSLACLRVLMQNGVPPSLEFNTAETIIIFVHPFSNRFSIACRTRLLTVVRFVFLTSVEEGVQMLFLGFNSREARSMRMRNCIFREEVWRGMQNFNLFAWIRFVLFLEKKEKSEIINKITFYIS